MTVTLSAHAELLVRALLSRDPERSPEELVEQGLHALSAGLGPQRGLHHLSDAEFDAWLDELGTYGDQIPPMDGETFSREMIYRDIDE